MGITNYRIDKIEANVDNRATEKVDVNESFSIGEVTKKNSQMLEVSWSFNTEYKNIGKLYLEGKLTYFTNDLSDKYEEKGENKKKRLVLKGEALKEVSNFILRRGLIEAIVLSKTLQLPPPLPLPSVKIEEKK